MRCAGIRDLGDTDGRRLALRSCSCRMQRDPAAMPVPDLPACLLLLSSTPMSPSVRRASCKQETSTHMSCKKFQANFSAMSFFYTSKYHVHICKYNNANHTEQISRLTPRASLHGSGVPRCHLRVPKARSAGVANQAQHPLEPDNNFVYIIRTWRELKLVGHFINLSPKQTHTRQQQQPQGPGTLPGMKQ